PNANAKTKTQQRSSPAGTRPAYQLLSTNTSADSSGPTPSPTSKQHEHIAARVLVEEATILSRTGVPGRPLRTLGWRRPRSLDAAASWPATEVRSILVCGSVRRPSES